MTTRAPGLALSSKAAETAGAPFEQSGKGRDALLNCLISGGDGRLECEPATGLNMYGHGPSPRPQDLAFGSSTASTISTPAFAAVEAYYADLSREMESRPAADIYAREISSRVAVSNLLRLHGLDQNPVTFSRVDAVKATSETDIHLFRSGAACAPRGSNNL